MILFLGFTFQNCNKEEDNIDCGCPPLKGEYFDINGIEIINYKKRGDCCADKMDINTSVELDKYYFSINYLVDYLSYQRNNYWNFSTINSAYACSCIFNGELGVKN